MIIEKNGMWYTATESNDKWTIKTENGKLSISFVVSKEICSTAEELREYVLNNNELF